MGLAAPQPWSRLRWIAVCAVVTMFAAGIVAFDARSRRARWRETASVRLDAARVVGPELALHASSRWLRHPTRSEPWAASQDGPALLDLDPAGAAAPPPVEALRAGWPAVRITLRSVPR